jgi:site-specific DNA-methyltransferase (adenine-specific)
MMEQHLLLGDSKDVLKDIKDGSIDLLATDPPYGIEFMGKSWDKVLPDKEIWGECYRVLKPGSFIAVMSSPRSDVLYRMIKDLEDAGFDMSFSPILWTYHTGFPKASDTSKLIDKRLGAEREVVGKNPNHRPNSPKDNSKGDYNPNSEGNKVITKSNSDLGKKYEGSKLGFQPKPAVEHIIIGMKPHGEKSYIDNVLNFEALPDNVKMTYPFLQVPKPAKKEKDFGMTGEEKKKPQRDEGQELFNVPHKNRPITSKNNHPTTKPVKLMSYIITLFTREGDWVLDPFLGSGTTGIASKLLNRNFVGVEREEEYMDIIQQRLDVSRETLVKFFKTEIKDTQTKLDL